MKAIPEQFWRDTFLYRLQGAMPTASLRAGVQPAPTGRMKAFCPGACLFYTRRVLKQASPVFLKALAKNN
jgi:hypothetical protein